MSDLKRLFEPLKVGPITVSNRIMLPGMPAGTVTDSELGPAPQMIAYYLERIKSRPGMAAIGACRVVPPSTQKQHPLPLYDDKYIGPLAAMVDAVHQYETKFGIQLWEGGGAANGRRSVSFGNFDDGEADHGRARCCGPENHGCR